MGLARNEKWEKKNGKKEGKNKSFGLNF